MADSNKNRNSIKDSDKKPGKGGNNPENEKNKKLSGNAGGESSSTRDDTSNPKYSRTDMRKEEKEKRANDDVQDR